MGIVENIPGHTMAATKKKPERKPPPKEIRDIPSRIEEARVELGWPDHGWQARLAQESKLSPGQISAIMSEARSKGIQAAMVVRIADALGVNPGWLLTGRGDMFGDGATRIDLRSLIRSEVAAAIKNS